MKTPANATSVKKCPPAAMRNTPSAMPNAIAPPYASRRHCGGAMVAGANVQNAPDGSPAMNEQLLGHGPPGFHHGVKGSAPPNSMTSMGRERPQWSLRSVLASRPGPSASVSTSNKADRPPISMRRRGKISLPPRARKPGATSKMISQREASRACCSQCCPYTLNLCVSGLKNNPERSRSNCA